MNIKVAIEEHGGRFSAIVAGKAHALAPVKIRHVALLCFKIKK